MENALVNLTYMIHDFDDAMTKLQQLLKNTHFQKLYKQKKV
jgi:hypothetical protein